VSKKSGVSVCALQNRCSKATQTVSPLFLFETKGTKRKSSQKEKCRCACGHNWLRSNLVSEAGGRFFAKKLRKKIS
jgi:hypothetical protein